MEGVRSVGTEKHEFDNRNQSYLNVFFLEKNDHQAIDERISNSGFPAADFSRSLIFSNKDLIGELKLVVLAKMKFDFAENSKNSELLGKVATAIFFCGQKTKKSQTSGLLGTESV